MKKALITTLWGAVLWGSVCLPQEPFAMEGDGFWRKALHNFAPLLFED